MKFFAGGLIKKNLKQCQKDQKISQKGSPGGIKGFASEHAVCWLLHNYFSGLAA